MLRKYVYTLNN